MNYLGRSRALFSQLSRAEKGYLKKYFKSRLNGLSSANRPVLEDLFFYIQGVNPESEFDGYANESGKEIFFLLLAGLTEFNRSDATIARSYVNQAEILIEKNLPSHARKLLLKAFKIARKINNLELLYEITEWQLAIDSQAAPTDKNRKILNNHFRKLDTIMHKQTVYFEQSA